MNKKIIIILSVVVVILLLAGGIYWFYSSKPASERPGIISALFPSAGEQQIQGLPTPGGGGGLPGGIQVEKTLTQLTQNAVSGAGAASTTVRYIEKSTGNIYEIEPNGQNRNRLSNVTILKTFESFWSVDANKLILRYFEEGAYPSVKTFSASLTATGTSTATTTLQGIFLPGSTTAVAISLAEDKIFYFIPTGEGIAGITADFGNKKQSNILNIPFSEFNINWPSKNIITLLTKPSATAEGILYSLDPKTGDFEKIIGGVNGLTALMSPDGARMIYSQSRNSGIEIKIFNLKDKTSSGFSLTTLPEKCVWSKIDKNILYCAVPNDLPTGDYPDSWYQGLISFNDSVWQINLSTGETNVLINETKSDVINLFLSKDENYLVFTNKKDNTLWSLKIK
jgi:hypothetical protein